MDRPAEHRDSHGNGYPPLTGLLANTVYELRASLDDTFPSGETATARVETANAGVSSFVMSNVGKTEVEITITLSDPIGGAQRFLVRVINSDIPRSERGSCGAFHDYAYGNCQVVWPFTCNVISGNCHSRLPKV